MSEHAAQAGKVADYILTVCRPLLDAEYQERIRVAHAPGAFEDHVFRVEVPDRAFGCLLGKKGANAEALRTLVRARARALGWGARVDVRIAAA